MIDQYKDYGLDSPYVPQALIKAFFEYWWGSAEDSAQRAKIDFVLKKGALGGRGIAIVESKGCDGMSPAVIPAQDGAQMFVFTPQAVTAFRKEVLAPFFADYAKKNGVTLNKVRGLVVACACSVAAGG